MASVLIFSFGLLNHKTRLMPWRTIVEVAQGMRSRGHEVDLVSLVSSGEFVSDKQPGDVLMIQRDSLEQMRQQLYSKLDVSEYDAIFLPVSISRNQLIRDLAFELKGYKVAYLPGSVFEFNQISRVVGKLPTRDFFPYLVQSLFPKALFKRALNQLGVDVLITNSEYSSRYLQQYLDQRVISIPPGRDSQRQSAITRSDQVASDLFVEGPFFVFLGPPLPIRGIEVLLDAYISVADEDDMPSLLCLIRADEHLDIDAAKARYETKWPHRKITYVWTSLSVSVLQDHLTKAQAVIMPFLIVPSEIPLAVYEAAGLGKIVVCTAPHGTGEFVSKFGITVSPGSKASLVEAMRFLKQHVNTAPNSDAIAAFRSLSEWSTVAFEWECVALRKCDT